MDDAKNELAASISKLQKALAGIHDGSLERAYVGCLQTLEQMLANLEEVDRLLREDGDDDK